MKARMITAIALLGLSVGMAVFSMLYVERCAGALEGALEKAMACTSMESTAWAAASDDVERVWARHKGFLHILLPHAVLNELEWAVGALPLHLEQRDKAMFVEQCVRGLQCLNTLREMERVSWGIIF